MKVTNRLIGADDDQLGDDIVDLVIEWGEDRKIGIRQLDHNRLTVVTRRIDDKDDLIRRIFIEPHSSGFIIQEYVWPTDDEQEADGE